MHTHLKSIAWLSRQPAWSPARYVWLSLVVTIAGLIVSATAWYTVSQRDDQLAALELSSRAEGHALSLQVGLILYLRKVSGLAALFESSDGTVSRAQFERFTKLIMNDQTAILGMSWISRVTREQRAAHGSTPRGSTASPAIRSRVWLPTAAWPHRRRRTTTFPYSTPRRRSPVPRCTGWTSMMAAYASERLIMRAIAARQPPVRCLRFKVAPASAADLLLLYRCIHRASRTKR